MKATPENSTFEETVKGGHAVSPTAVAADKTEPTEAMSSVDLFILLDHEFIIEVNDGTDDRRIYETYLSFTRAIVSVYHGRHSKDEIRSALIIAEDHLTIMLEDITEECDIAVRFVGRAINFIQKYIQSIAEWFAANGMAEKKTVTEKKAGLDETESATAYSFGFNGEFTEFVELTDALLEYECFDKINDGTFKDSTFIRVMLDLFGFGHKTVNHFRATRNKIYNKIPKEGKGRCKFLPGILENIEDIWEKRFMKV